ncbi:MAG: hypothetical protein N2691_05835 [Patescibacteria group bacterium]|nr:hypothetical protein [Patescibacteria group bacterium]
MKKAVGFRAFIVVVVLVALVVNIAMLVIALGRSTGASRIQPDLLLAVTLPIQELRGVVLDSSNSHVTLEIVPFSAPGESRQNVRSRVTINDKTVVSLFDPLDATPGSTLRLNVSQIKKGDQVTVRLAEDLRVNPDAPVAASITVEKPAYTLSGTVEQVNDGTITIVGTAVRLNALNAFADSDTFQVLVPEGAQILSPPGSAPGPSSARGRITDISKGAVVVVQTEQKPGTGAVRARSVQILPTPMAPGAEGNMAVPQTTPAGTSSAQVGQSITPLP